ncbi:MAG: hypothetical protein MJ173_06935 [Clostridia bacterium]|nr:hypothetical protein [Clostridia bacterium]
MNKKIIAAIAMLLVSAMIFSFAGCSSTAEEETTTTIKAKTPLPTDITTSYDEESRVVTDTTYSPEALAANSKTIFEYFNVRINETKNGKAAVSMKSEKKISKSVDENGDSIKMSENEYINAAITALDSYMLPTKKESIEYGEDLAAFLPVKGQNYVSKLTMDEIESATCVDEGVNRTITVNLKSPALPATIEKAYDLDDVNKVIGEFKKAEKYLTVGTPVVSYRDCQIIIVADVETDAVKEIKYVKVCDVAVDVTGVGSLAEIGTVPVKFCYTNTVSYGIDNTNPAETTTLAEK